LKGVRSVGQLEKTLWLGMCTSFNWSFFYNKIVISSKNSKFITNQPTDQTCHYINHNTHN
jgi:hypothetical protein